MEADNRFAAVTLIFFAFFQATTHSAQLVSISLLAEAVIYFLGLFQNFSPYNSLPRFSLRILIDACVILLSFQMLHQIEYNPTDYGFSVLVTIVVYISTDQKVSWIKLAGIINVLMLLFLPSFWLMILLEKISDFYCLFLPTSVVQFSKAKKCILCNETFTEGLLLPCGDSFHFRCLRRWNNIKLECPECGTNYALSIFQNMLQTKKY